MNLLNNAYNNMVDNFQTIKWIFHETEEIKNRLQGLKRKEGEDGTDRISNLDTRVIEMEKKMDRMEISLHNSAN